MNVNYYQKTKSVIDNLNGKKPTLLLHSCCGPCSSSVMEFLTKYFRVTVYYYNPNVYPAEEYALRLNTQHRIVDGMYPDGSVNTVEGEYDPSVFYSAVKGSEDTPEGGERCVRCIAMRMENTALYARSHGYGYFTTTLSVSPHKDAVAINTIGKALEEKYGVAFLYSDFKKNDGYLRSIRLSKEYGLYRQDYCGCEFSLRKD